MCVDKYHWGFFKKLTVHAFMCNLQRLKCGKLYFNTLFKSSDEITEEKWNDVDDDNTMKMTTESSIRSLTYAKQGKVRSRDYGRKFIERREEEEEEEKINSNNNTILHLETVKSSDPDDFSPLSWNSKSSVHAINVRALAVCFFFSRIRRMMK